MCRKKRQGIVPIHGVNSILGVKNTKPLAFCLHLRTRKEAMWDCKPEPLR